VHLADFLAGCPATPENRNRYACVAASDDPNASVAVLRGAANGQRWTFQWEGVLPNLDRSGGGGNIGPDGTLGDAQNALAGIDIRAREVDAFGRVITAGDIVTVLTQPELSDPTCAASVPVTTAGTPPLCELERRVAAVNNIAGKVSLTLDRPFAPACFPGGDVAYRVRAGESFTVLVTDINGNTLLTSRVAPGDVYTPGGIPNASPSVGFTVRADRNWGAGRDACQRYDVAGNPMGGIDKVYSRAGASAFVVNDAFAAVRTGLSFDLLGNVTGTVGKVPAGMVMTRPSGAIPARLYVSFAGTGNLLANSPFDTANLLTVDQTFKVLQ
jgi:hypothetical protein